MEDRTFEITDFPDVVLSEISKAASRSYTEDGTCLYDILLPHLSDRDELRRIGESSFNSLFESMNDIVREVSLGDDGTLTVVLSIPDFGGTDTQAQTAIERYLSMAALTGWLSQHNRPDEEKIFEAARDSALTQLKSILYQRKPITRE